MLHVLFLSYALVHRKKKKNDIIFIFFPCQTPHGPADLIGLGTCPANIRSLPSHLSLVRPRLASEIPQDLSSGELATLFWSRMDHSSPGSPCVWGRGRGYVEVGVVGTPPSSIPGLLKKLPQGVPLGPLPALCAL